MVLQYECILSNGTWFFIINLKLWNLYKITQWMLVSNTKGLIKCLIVSLIMYYNDCSIFILSTPKSNQVLWNVIVPIDLLSLNWRNNCIFFTEI